MKFLAANVLIYAYYKPRRQLTNRERAMKTLAKQIVNDVSKGKEEVMTTVVHLSEMTNILKQGVSLEMLHEVVFGFLTTSNVQVVGVTREEYFVANELGMELRLDPNDALAVQVMRRRDIGEIYSFDKDFEGVEGVVRLPRIE